jgi:hypothetical protein
VRRKRRCEGRAKEQKNGSFSLIERVILSAGAMLIFSVSFQIDQMPEGEVMENKVIYILHAKDTHKLEQCTSLLN